MHAGEVHYDTWGPLGEAIGITFRLTDATPVKTTLATTTAPLVLVVSQDIYRSLITAIPLRRSWGQTRLRHRYDGIDDRTFAPLVRRRSVVTPGLAGCTSRVMAFIPVFAAVGGGWTGLTRGWGRAGPAARPAAIARPGRSSIP